MNCTSEQLGFDLPLAIPPTHLAAMDELVRLANPHLTVDLSRTLMEYQNQWWSIVDCIHQVAAPLKARMAEIEKQKPLSRISRLELKACRDALHDLDVIAESLWVDNVFPQIELAFDAAGLDGDGRDWLNEDVLSNDRACEFVGQKTLSDLIEMAKS